MRRAAVLAIAAAIALESGAGTAAPLAGDLLVTDSVADRLLRVRPSTGEVEQLGPATQFVIPGGVVWSQGQIFVSDLVGVVWSVDPETGAAAPLPLAPGTLSSPFGIDADARGSLYLFDSDPGRVVRLVPTNGSGWEARPFDADVPNFGRGLSITRDDDGDAVDAFFAAITFPDEGLWRLRVATDEAVSVAETPAGMGLEIYGVAAVGNCAELLCTIAFTEFVPGTTGDCPCTQARIAAFSVFAIFAGVATVYDFPDGRCPLGVAAVSASEFYVGTVANQCTNAGARIERIYATGSGYASDVVAELPPLGALAGTRPTDVAIVPEPDAGALAFAASLALALSARRASATRLAPTRAAKPRRPPPARAA